MLKSHSRIRFSRLAVVAVLAAAQLWADSDASMALRFKLFLHTPEVFADRWLGMMPIDWNAPVAAAGSLWYIQPEGPVGFVPMPTLADFVRRRGVPGLDLTGQKDILDPDLEALAGLSELRLLNLSGTRVSDRGISVLGRLENLEILILNDQISDSGLEGLPRFPRLKELGLSGTQITDHGVASLQKYPTLLKLDLSHTKVGNTGLEALRPLALRQLTLGTRVSDGGMAAIAAISSLGQIDLSETAVTDQGMAQLSPLKQIHTFFAPRAITDAGITALSRWGGLRRLDLTGTRLSGQSLTRLSSLAGLEELALSNTALDDASLVALLHLRRLRYLEISDTRITPAAFSALSKMSSLEVLSMSWKGTPSEKDLAALGSLPHLHTLILNGESVPRRFLDRLQAQSRTSENSLRTDSIAMGVRIHQWMESALAPIWDISLIQSVWAEDPSSAVSPEITNDQTAPSIASAKDYTGLKRIHVVESELDEVIPVVSAPAIDVPEDNEKNFLGDFSVGVQGKKK